MRYFTYMIHRLLSILAVTLAFCLVTLNICPAQASSVDAAGTASWPSGPSVNAQAAIVMELSTGTILYEKNATDAMFPASITKIMTGLLAVEHASMDEIVAMMKDAIVDAENQTVYVGHADCRADADELAAKVKAATGCKDTYIFDIDPIIGASVGPSMIVLYAFGKKVEIVG